MATMQKITPCLWFDKEAEEAARFYCGIFQSSKITKISRYTEAGREVHGGEPGSVLAVAFELGGQQFSALNGGPMFTFNEAISLQVGCDSQQEVDYFWGKLTAGGSEQPCGWLKDRYGLSWQVFPSVLLEMLNDQDTARAGRVMNEMLTMKKIDLSQLERAQRGE